MTRRVIGIDKNNENQKKIIMTNTRTCYSNDSTIISRINIITEEWLKSWKHDASTHMYVYKTRTHTHTNTQTDRRINTHTHTHKHTNNSYNNEDDDDTMISRTNIIL